jgi:hypothetical protein
MCQLRVPCATLHVLCEKNNLPSGPSEKGVISHFQHVFRRDLENIPIPIVAFFLLYHVRGLKRNLFSHNFVSPSCGDNECVTLNRATFYSNSITSREVKQCCCPK